eukprot:15250661-Alexandrium_andersonii.AAC.1
MLRAGPRGSSRHRPLKFNLLRLEVDFPTSEVNLSTPERAFRPEVETLTSGVEQLTSEVGTSISEDHD